MLLESAIFSAIGIKLYGLYMASLKQPTYSTNMIMLLSGNFSFTKFVVTDGYVRFSKQYPVKKCYYLLLSLSFSLSLSISQTVLVFIKTFHFITLLIYHLSLQN